MAWEVVEGPWEVVRGSCGGRKGGRKLVVGRKLSRVGSWRRRNGGVGVKEERKCGAVGEVREEVGRRSCRGAVGSRKLQEGRRSCPGRVVGSCGGGSCGRGVGSCGRRRKLWEAVGSCGGVGSWEEWGCGRAGGSWKVVEVVGREVVGSCGWRRKLWDGSRKLSVESVEVVGGQ
ncbi:hypothetical protein FNV43_RR10031 [Rhamnella rubrinervis]|uniref:Uncharacterized protein n=1 Tax=Rhamnella rubrinervis TaxID=2594499 RepID=A0A8K0MKR7_9ROSA|nr:hypothetical protein FNV43_RR10031 [Rhamnella rubrinervis]